MTKIKEVQNSTNDLDLLFNILPKNLTCLLKESNKLSELTEIVLDIGRHPEIRYDKTVIELSTLKEITQTDINKITEKLGKFNTDNRAGIERTLHRISCIRNRSGKIIGLTCRVGRAIMGTIEMLQDIITSGENILFLGPPGIGKTTNLRETARVLSIQKDKRILIVDTSNEIAGDGDIPHPGIGKSRRMQVPSPDKQHAIMIEAVENHMPEVIIVDEIGTEEEAKAARTIAERGVQLIATAHGHTLENLIKNPTLSDLVGGIQSVILGDEEAKFRGTQKTVLERKSLPTFDRVIEIQNRNIFAIYQDTKTCVDAFLRKQTVAPEIRQKDQEGNVEIKQGNTQKLIETEPDDTTINHALNTENSTKIYAYGITATKLQHAINILNIPGNIAYTISDADIILTTKTQIKSKTKINQLTEGRQLPIHVIKNDSLTQLTKFFRDFFQLTETDNDIESEAIKEITDICSKVKTEKKVLDASSHSAYIRRLQHQMVQELGLNSLSTGKEPNRRVRVYPTK